VDIASDLSNHFLASVKEIKTKTDTGEIISHRYAVGGSTDTGEETVYSFEIGQWVAKDSLTVDSYKINLGFNFENSSFELSHRYRPIRLYTRNSSFIRARYADLSSNSNSISYKYKGIKNWQISADYIKNSYSKKISALATEPVFLFLFTPDTLSLASGFEDSASALSVTFYAKDFSAGLSRDQSISAVDKSELNQNSTFFSFVLAKDYLLSFKLANTKIKDVEGASLSFGVSLDVSFN